MRVTITHTKTPEQIKANIDRGFEDIFKGLPGGPITIKDTQRTWVGNQLNFSFNARAAFLTVPVKGWVLVEDKLVTVEVDMPAFLQKFIPEEKVKTAVESSVRGLLT